MTFTANNTGGRYDLTNKIGTTADSYGGITPNGSTYYRKRILASAVGIENDNTSLKTLNDFGLTSITPYIVVYFWRRTA